MAQRLGSTPVLTDLAGVDLLDPQQGEATRILRLVGSQQDGVVSTTDPDTVRWAFCPGCARGPDPIAFSPNGSQVLLFAGGDGTKDVSIRSARDGTISSDLVTSLPVDEARWQDDDHLLLDIVGGRDEHDVYALVRCTVDGACARLTPWQSNPIWEYYDQ